MTKKVPEGWQKAINDDVFRLNKGTVIKEFSETPAQGFVPYLLIESFNGAADKYVKAGKATLCEESDPLIVMDGSRSGLVMRGRSGVIGSTLASVTPKADVNLSKDFLYYHLTSLYKFLNLGKTAGAVPHVDRRVLMDLPFLVPPLPEQEKIAEILGSVDEAIAATRQVIERTRSLKRSLTQTLLTKGIPGRHKKFKDSPLGKIPEGWSLATLEEIGENGWPSIRTGPFGSSLKSEHFCERGTPVITIGSLGEGEIVAKELFYTCDDVAKELSAYAVRFGDIVFSRVADIGRSALITKEQEGWIISSNLMRICLDKDKAEPAFIYQSIIGSPLIQTQLRDKTSDAGRMIVTSRSMKQIEFPIPSIQEQNEIIDILSAIEMRLKNEELFTHKLMQVKSSLMSTLLSGHVRVPVLHKQQRKGAA